MVGTIFTIIVYITSSLAIIGIVPPDQLLQSTAPFSDAAELFLGKSSKYFVSACAVIATMGALNGWILLQGKIPLAAASDRLFPAIFRKKNRKGAPILGIVLSSCLASLLMITNFTKGLVSAFTFMITLSTLATLVPYLFTAGSFAIIRFRNGDKRITTPIWMAGLAFAFCIWIIVGCGREVVYYGFLLLILGIPFYVMMKHR